MKIRAGQNFAFDVKVEGEPVPETSWSLKGGKVTNSERTKIKDEPYNTKLNCRGATRAESGVYKLKAVNQWGEDEAEVEVIVLDRPSPPNGPLKVEDIHAEGCTLKWKPPSDDGGVPIDHYVVEKMDMATGLWTPAGTTKGSECELAVDTLNPDHSYKFRVKAVNRQGESDALETDKPVVAKNPFGEFMKVAIATHIG